jgi:hypothetical protein
MDTNQFNATFWLSVLGVVCGFLSGALVYAIKSKCIHCSVCYGLISIKRDVQIELEEQKFEIEHGINPNTIDNGQQHN